MLCRKCGHDKSYFDAASFKYGDGSVGCSYGQDFNDACGCKCIFDEQRVVSRAELMLVLDRNLEAARIPITVRSYNQILTDLGFSLDE